MEGARECARLDEEILGKSEDGLGLSVSPHHGCRVTFRGGGHVLVTTAEGQDEMKLELETRNKPSGCSLHARGLMTGRAGG